MFIRNNIYIIKPMKNIKKVRGVTKYYFTKLWSRIKNIKFRCKYDIMYKLGVFPIIIFLSIYLKNMSIYFSSL